MLKIHFGYPIESGWEAKRERLGREQPIICRQRDDCDLKYGGGPGHKRRGKVKKIEWGAIHKK